MESHLHITTQKWNKQSIYIKSSMYGSRPSYKTRSLMERNPLALQTHSLNRKLHLVESSIFYNNKILSTTNNKSKS